MALAAGYLNASIYKVGEAQTALEEVRKLSAEFTDAGDVRTAEACELAGFVEFQGGYFQKAVDQYKNALNVLDETNKDNANLKARIQLRLARALMMTGKLKESEELIENLLAYYKSSVGENHIDTLETMLASAQLHRIREQFSKAGRIAKTVKQAAEKVAGKSATVTIEASNELGQALAYAFRSTESVDELQSAISSCETNRGPNDPLLIESHVILSKTYAGSENLEEAVKELAKATSIGSNLPAAHPLKINAILAGAYLHEKNEKPDEAVKLYELVINAVSNQYGERSVNMLAPLAEYALFDAQQNRGHVWSVFQRLNNIQLKLLPPDHPLLGQTWERVGFCHLMKKSYPEAENAYNLSRQIRTVNKSEVPRSPGLTLTRAIKNRFSAADSIAKDDEVVMPKYKAQLDELVAKYGENDPSVADLRVLMCLEFEKRKYWAKTLATEALKNWYQYLVGTSPGSIRFTRLNSERYKSQVSEQRFRSADELYKFSALSLLNIAQILGSYGDREQSSQASLLSLAAINSCSSLNDKTLSSICLELNEVFLQSADYVSAREAAELAIKCAELQTSSELTHLARLRLCQTLLAEGDTVSATSLLTVLEKDLAIDAPQPDYNDALLLHLLSLMHEEQKDIPRALELEQRSYSILKSLNPGYEIDRDKSFVRTVALSLATKGMDPSSAKKQLLPLFDRYLYVSEPSSKLLLASIYATVSDAERANNNEREAIAFARRALEIQHREPSAFQAALDQRLNIAAMFFKLKDKKWAFSEAWETAFETNNFIERSFPNLSLAEQLSYAPRLNRIVDALYSYADNDEDFRSGYDVSYSWQGLVVDMQRKRARRLTFRQSDPKSPDNIGETSRRIAEIERTLEQGAEFTDDLANELVALTSKKERLERESATTGPMSFSADLDVNFGLLRSAQDLLKNDEAFLHVVQFTDLADNVAKYKIVISGKTFGPISVGPFLVSEMDRNLSDWLIEIGAVPENFFDVRTLSPDEEPVTPPKVIGDGKRQWTFFQNRLRDQIMAALPDKVNRLWICPNGALVRLPWPYLFSDTSAREVTQVNSFRELYKSTHLMKFRRKEQQMLIVGNLKYFSKDGRALSNTESELRGVVKIASDAHIKPVEFEQEDADRMTLLGQLPRYEYVHLATHGYFNDPLGKPSARLSEGYRQIRSRLFERNPFVLSGLVASVTKDKNGAEGSGKISAEELLSVPMPFCKLVTLSACETGLGRAAPSQGILGLRSAILGAGAESMLVSLWNVPDESTAALMQKFYEYYLILNKTKSESLRLAQKDVEGKWKSPRYWAGWVLVGNAWGD